MRGTKSSGSQPPEVAHDVPAESLAGDAEDEEVDGEIDVVDELADLLGQHEVLAVQPAPSGHHDQQVEPVGVAGQVEHEEDAGDPHQQLGGPHLRLGHEAVLHPPRPPSTPSSGPGRSGR